MKNCPHCALTLSVRPNTSSIEIFSNGLYCSAILLCHNCQAEFELECNLDGRPVTPVLRELMENGTTKRAIGC